MTPNIIVRRGFDDIHIFIIWDVDVNLPIGWMSVWYSEWVKHITIKKDYERIEHNIDSLIIKD